MNTEHMNDELRPEYDLTKLKVRRVGVGRKLMQENGVHLDMDVARVFPNSESVNEALRFLIRISKEHQTELPPK
jgi:hypothetical protein